MLIFQGVCTQKHPEEYIYASDFLGAFQVAAQIHPNW